MKKKSNYLLLVLCSLLFLTACSLTLPSKSREISEFIPQEKTEIVFDVKLGEDFVKENYPKNCRWEKLERVVDGDTIVTKKSGKIRLIGINTPEVKSPFTEEESGGKEASEKIRQLLSKNLSPQSGTPLGRGENLIEKVCLIHDDMGDKIDKYGRSLDYVFLEDRTDINAEMIKTGFAHWYSQFPYSRKGEFKVYEDQAKEKEFGLWE